MAVTGKETTGITKSYMSAKNPGFYLAAFLIILWLLCWVLFMGLFRKASWAGLPAITWSMIGVGLVAIIVSIAAIPIFNRFEKN